MSGRRIAVTGASGYLAKGLINRLEREPSVEIILAFDVRSPNWDYPSKVRFQKRDINDPLEDLLKEFDIDSVVHLAFVLNPGKRRTEARRVNVNGTANLIDACQKAKVSYLLYLSSTSIYGAHADTPEGIAEDSPVRPLKGFQYSEDKASAEALILEATNSYLEFTSTILRVCPVMGANADNFIADAFSKPFLIGVKGYDPPMQIVHEYDVTEAMWRCLIDMAPGVYNLAPDNTVRWSEMASMFGRKLISLPAPILYGLVSITWSLGLQRDSPPSGLNFIRYGLNVSSEKIRQNLGFAPKYTSREAWRAFVERESQTIVANGVRS